MTRIDRLERENLAADQGRISARIMDVTPPLDGRFRWSDYFERALQSIQEPLISNKIDYDYKFPVFEHKRKGKTLAPLQQATENALFYRKLRAFIVDEAQHLVELTNDETVIRQLNSIKCLADRSCVTHVLIGTYSLGNALRLNGQLLRRCRVFEFRSYDPTEDSDRKAFQKALGKFQEQMPIPLAFNLENQLDLCIERSACCIGIMRDWLVKSINLALEFESKELQLKHLKAEAFSKTQIQIVYEEIKKGRESLASLLDEEDYRRQILRELEAERKKRKEKTRTKNKNPFQRKPGRDAVGVTEDYDLSGIDVDSEQDEKESA